MQSLKFTRTNGNIPKKLAGEDHVSGLVIYSAALPSGFSESERIKAVSTIETAEALGITADADNWDIRVLHYQLSEIFRINPGISLYVGIFTSPEGANTYAEVKKMQNFTDGRLRQLGVWDGTHTPRGRQPHGPARGRCDARRAGYAAGHHLRSEGLGRGVAAEQSRG